MRGSQYSTCKGKQLLSQECEVVKPLSQLWSDFKYVMRDQRNLIQIHFLGVLVLTDFLAEFMQAVD